MRNLFAAQMTELAKADSRVALLSGDIGNKLFDKFKQVDPARFLNCGIAEGSMMSVAAGMALSGMRPFVYTITPFTTTRCFEQIRVDVCYHEAPVVIVGTGSGLSYAELGPTHHSLEDLAILRTLPGMQVLAPCDTIELKILMAKALESGKPTYIRIGKKGEPNIYSEVPDLQIGKASIIQPGDKVALLSTGVVMPMVLEASQHIAQKTGIKPEVVSFHTIKPLDEEYLTRAVRQFDTIVTVEEHGVIGGLGSAISEWLHRHGHETNLVSIGTPDAFMHEIGSQDYARHKYGLTPEGIAAQVLKRSNISK